MSESRKRYIDVGEGTLFRATGSTNPKAPGYTGQITVNGEEYNLAAWVRESGKDGKKFFSLSVTKVEELDSSSTSGSFSPRPSISDQDIPF